VTTTVRLRDPRDVELRVGDRTVIPAGSEVTDAQVASGSIPTGDFSSSVYEVRAAREASGALSLRWATALAVSNGERHLLVAPDGTVPLAMEGAALGLPRTPGEPSLVIPECGWLGYQGRGVYSALSGQPCTPDVHYRASLVTPWSNVLEVREERTDHPRVDDRNYIFMRILAGALGTAGLVAADVGVADSHPKPAITGLLISANVLVALPLLYWVFRPLSQTTVLYLQR
jgi:hypothetical protein